MLNIKFLGDEPCVKESEALIVGLLVVVLSVALVYPQAKSVIGQGFRFDATKLKDPNLWTQVNEQPHYLSSTVDSLCRIAHRRDFEFERKRNPHASTYITVYVNKIGREAMFATGRHGFQKDRSLSKKR